MLEKSDRAERVASLSIALFDDHERRVGRLERKVDRLMHERAIAQASRATDA